MGRAYPAERKGLEDPGAMEKSLLGWSQQKGQWLQQWAVVIGWNPVLWKSTMAVMWEEMRRVDSSLHSAHQQLVASVQPFPFLCTSLLGDGAACLCFSWTSSCRAQLFSRNILFIITALWVGGSVIMSAFMKEKLSPKGIEHRAGEIPAWTSPAGWRQGAWALSSFC